MYFTKTNYIFSLHFFIQGTSIYFLLIQTPPPYLSLSLSLSLSLFTIFLFSLIFTLTFLSPIFSLDETFFFQETFSSLSLSPLFFFLIHSDFYSHFSFTNTFLRRSNFSFKKLPPLSLSSFLRLSISLPLLVFMHARLGAMKRKEVIIDLFQMSFVTHCTLPTSQRCHWFSRCRVTSAFVMQFYSGSSSFLILLTLCRTFAFSFFEVRFYGQLNAICLVLILFACDVTLMEMIRCSF